MLQAPTSATTGGFGGGNKASSITLALTDSQTQKLMFADKNGTWWLVLRPVARPADSLESVETIESILEGGLGHARDRPAHERQRHREHQQWQLTTSATTPPA